MDAHVHARLEVCDGLLCANANKRQFKSVCGFFNSQTIIFAQTFQQDNPYPQKTRRPQASHILCHSGSAVCVIAGAFCETHTVCLFMVIECICFDIRVMDYLRNVSITVPTSVLKASVNFHTPVVTQYRK